MKISSIKGSVYESDGFGSMRKLEPGMVIKDGAYLEFSPGSVLSAKWGEKSVEINSDLLNSIDSDNGLFLVAEIKTALLSLSSQQQEASQENAGLETKGFISDNRESFIEEHSADHGEKSTNVLGESEAQTLLGYSVDNIIFGGVGNDTIRDFTGDDKLSGSSDDDLIADSKGEDKIYGDDGNDILLSSSGDDALMGGAGEDELYGNTDDDILSGGSGSDILSGGEGYDELTGGFGKDTFVFDGELGSEIDTITDFGKGADAIDLADILMTETDYVIGEDIDKYVLVTPSADGAVISIDATGDSGNTSSSAVFVLTGVSAGSLGSASDMVEHGQLIVITNTVEY